MDKYKINLNKAIKAGRERNYKKAIQLLTEIVCNTDNFPIALLYLGRSYHAVNEYEKAINILEFYLKIKPNSASGNLFAGRTYLVLGLYHKAIIKLKKAIMVNPNYYLVYSFIGLAYLKIKKIETAIQYFEIALGLAPDNLNLFNGYLNALLVKAIKFFYKTRFEEAMQIFEFILQHRKNAFLPILYLARIYRETGNYRKALLNYEIAIQLSPDDAVLKIQKALLLLKLGNRDEALHELKNNSLLHNFSAIQAQAFTPFMLLKYTALSYFQQKEYKKAIYYSKKILKENYKDNDAHAIMAESYCILGELLKAKNHYIRSLEIQYSPQIHYALLQILWLSQDYLSLQEQVKKIQSKDPENKIASYFNALSLVYTNAKPEVIINALQNQIKISGPDPQLMTMMGQIYFKYDFPELAENWLLRTLKIIDNDQKTLLTLIEVSKALHNNKKSLNYYKLYFNVFPEDRSLKKDFIKILIQEKKYQQAINELNVLLPYEVTNKSFKKLLLNCYLKLEKYNEAIFILKQLLKDKPDNLDLFQCFIYCLEMTNRRQIAITILENVKKFFNDHPAVLTSLGVLYFRDNNYEKALTIFRFLLSITPDNWKIYHNLGIIYKKMGNLIFAQKFRKRAEEYKYMTKK